MPRDIIMPALGMAQDSGVIVAWHKAAGDAVAPGDVLFEVETDKATMEVEADAAGVLADVAAAAGDDVPVGQVIARILARGEEPRAAEPASASAPEPQSDALPEGHGVIMPTLGMAQDSGLLVTWLKTAGDAVGADDPLFEVETDKSTVEVPVGADGFVAALLAEPGEDVPVGQVIAIISATAPETTVSRSAAAGAAPKPEPQEAPQKAAAKPATEREKPAPAPAVGGRVLASPKARRLALEQGLDLGDLVRAGHPQPFHVRDLEALKALPKPESAPAAQAHTAPPRHLSATLPAHGFDGFAAWAADAAQLPDSGAILAGFAAASMGRPLRVALHRPPAAPRSFDASPRLGRTTEGDGAPDLRLRDLRNAAVTGLRLGAEEVPVLTLTQGDNGALTLTLECAAHHLDADQALDLLSNFAGRMQQPLRHLL